MTESRSCLQCGAAHVLKRASLAPGLDALRCETCGGTLLDVADYRRWREREPVAPTAGESALQGEDTPARICQSCKRLMHRYRVGTQPDFRIDHCAACRTIWFDRGEWEALVRAGLALQLTEIASDAWQRRMQSAEAQARREAGLRAKYGDACIDELQRVREWLAGQPAREELIALLRAGW